MGGFAKYGSDTVNPQTTDLSKCSSFNVTSHDTRNLFPQNTNRYCLSGNNDTILNFTKKDLIYLNELITNNRADEKILQEKNITAPQEIGKNQTFCPITRGNTPQKTTFWPNVTNIQDMCQEENVVAIARVKEGGKEGTFWYVSNGEVQKAIISDKLRLNQAMKEVLNGTKIQKLSTDPFNGQQKNLMTIGLDKFQVNVAPDNNRYYLNKIITFSDGDENITF